MKGVIDGRRQILADYLHKHRRPLKVSSFIGVFGNKICSFMQIFFQKTTIKPLTIIGLWCLCKYWAKICLEISLNIPTALDCPYLLSGTDKNSENRITGVY